jgi:choline dehydrogenase-like flavoprotein
VDADVIIIGSGAGGGTLARALAPTGLSILILERGDYLPREQPNWEAEAVFRNHRYHTDESWRDARGRPFRPVTGYHVGGNTKFYGAAILRRRLTDFAPRIHRDGETPGWPITYADLAPHYDTAERWYFAHGQAGADPTEPPRSQAFPYPPMAHEPYMARLAEALGQLGLNPFPLPLAVNRDALHPHTSACIRCATCDGFPCLVHAKGDAEICGIAPALAHANVRLLRNQRVIRLETSDDGGKIGRVCTEQASYTARIVVLAAGAIQSAALLLASANARAPRGLANRSGQVGRNYLCHINSACLAINPIRENPTVFQKTIGINDFYEHSGDPAYPYPLGHIQNLGKVTPSVLQAEHPHLPAGIVRLIAHHSVDWWLTTEDLPVPENRVTLDAQGAIRLSWNPRNLESHRRLCARWRGILHTLGYPLVFFQRMGIEATAHQAGTLVFGDNPEKSVLDPSCRAHDLANLYVADASFMPSISAVNPSLTVMANALRVAEHLKTRFAEGGLP